jgi:uncharacterized protein (UPF0548 family)
MISLSRPARAEIDAFLARVSRQPFSYAAVGATRDEQPPAGYVVDHRRVCVGRGEHAFAATCAALRAWDTFALGWTRACWPDTPLVAGNAFASLTRLAGIWCLNGCRIVYVDELASSTRRFRFAWGTVADHAAQGEERFTVEHRDDDSVWYDLYAFSRPQHWLVRLGYPAVRLIQKRFGKQSLRAVARSVRRRLARSDVAASF